MSSPLFMRELQQQAITLRPYQEQAVQDLRRSIAAGNRRVVLQAGTGSGKTVIASEIIKRAIQKESACLFLAHRRELIEQCSDKLHRFGTPHGIIMAGKVGNPRELVQVASIQTLWSRVFVREKMRLPEAQLIVLDECHRTLSRTYRKLIDEYPCTVVLGLTATPCRGDGRGLGEIYDDMVQCPSVRELTKQGYLVPVKYYAPSSPDLTGVKVRMGDYVESELEERLDKPPLIGDVVEHWGRLAEGRKTVVFCVGVKHSVHMAGEFEKVGVRVAHLDGSTPLEERAAILQDLAEGDLQVVCNCMVLTEGWDCPPVSCCVIARPTKSLGLYMQMAGRTLRPFPGKEDCLILDHAGAVHEHGFVEQPVPWSLDGKSRVQDRIAQQRGSKGEPKPVTCPECKGVFSRKPSCPHCGWRPQKAGEEYHWIKGQLVKVDATGEKALPYSVSDRRRWYRELLGVAQRRGYKDGWVAHSYRKKFGKWPPSQFKKQGALMATTPEVLAFVRHLQIRYAKRRAK